MTPQERDSLCAKLFPHFDEPEWDVGELKSDIRAFVERLEPLVEAVRFIDSELESALREARAVRNPVALMEHLACRVRALLSGVEVKP